MAFGNSGGYLPSSYTISFTIPKEPLHRPPATHKLNLSIICAPIATLITDYKLVTSSILIASFKRPNSNPESSALTSINLLVNFFTIILFNKSTFLRRELSIMFISLTSWVVAYFKKL